MQVFEDVSEIPNQKNTVITIGTFDGIHHGHKKILDTVIDRANETSGRNFLITFHPHPRNVLAGDFRLKILTTLDEKLHLLESYGINNVLVINFTSGFSQLSSVEFFLKYIINGTGISEIVIGHDHHFGKGRSGNEQTLKDLGNEHGFNVTKVEPFIIDQEVVSSTKIRTYLNEGNLSKANKQLGRYYSFKGKVIQGDKRGRLLGFPTANIELNDENKLLPQIGIYLCGVKVKDKNYYGLLSIGKRPTFYDAGKIIPEVFIYDFEDDIYNEMIEVRLIDRLRGEEKYDSADALITQMLEDKRKGKEILSKIINPG